MTISKFKTLYWVLIFCTQQLFSRLILSPRGWLSHTRDSYNTSHLITVLIVYILQYYNKYRNIDTTCCGWVKKNRAGLKMLECLHCKVLTSQFGSQRLHRLIIFYSMLFWQACSVFPPSEVFLSHTNLYSPFQKLSLIPFRTFWPLSLCACQSTVNTL